MGSFLLLADAQRKGIMEKTGSFQDPKPPLCQVGPFSYPTMLSLPDTSATSDAPVLCHVVSSVR